MSSLLTRPLLWYATKLDTHPIMTKSITSGLISAGGDLLCQRKCRRRPRQASKEEGYEPIGGGAEPDDDRHPGGYDWTRTLRFGLIGSCLVAPTVNFWYGLLMSRIPGQTIGATATRLFLDQGCFAPVFTAVFISTLTALEHVTSSLPWDKAGGGNSAVKADRAGDSAGDLAGRISTRLREDLPQAIAVGWGIWVPSMAVMFRYVPGKYQVLYSNVIAFAWNGYLSWRTHEAECRGDDEDCGDGTSKLELEGPGGASPRSVFDV